MTGDNLQQNYPLHVLVGSMLRQGHLPFWDPYLFSGTPLLAGFNAGAFYPLVGLFVIMPDRVAWIATEVILFSLIGVGMYQFLRALALSTTACVLAAVTFSCSGVVLGQANHIDMTEGFASIPFMLLAVLHIVRDGRWRWSVVLGLGFALVILAGAPEAMLDEALLVIVYAAVSAGLDRRRWWRILTRCGAGAVLALSLAAVQWLPGISAIANSQRSGLGSSFAASGSFPPAYGLLSLVPYLYGGYGHLGEAGFFSHYNLAEVEIYAGILPVVALFSLWRPRWPSRLPGGERRTWYVVGCIGLLLAFGANTPLEHLFNSIPLYGRQRLQSRNMIDVAVAMCVLFAGWLDRRTDAHTDGDAGTGAGAGAGTVTFDRRVALVPLVAVLGLASWAVVAPASLITSLSSGSGSPAEVHTVREATFIALGFCLGAAAIVWLRPVLRHRHWILLVTAFMTLDLGLSVGTSQLVSTPSNALVSGRTALENDVARHLAPSGRFDVFNPQEYVNGAGAEVTGLPDDNILAHLPAVGGYASIVSGNYDARTLTHDSGQLNVALFGTGALDALDLVDLVTAPEYFLVPIAGAPTSAGAIQPMTEAPGTDPVLPMGLRSSAVGGPYPAYPPARPALVTSQSTRWFFGETLRPARASVLLTAADLAPTVIRFGTIRATGTVRWGPPVTVAAGARGAEGALPVGAADGLAVEVVSGRLPAQQATITVGSRRYELDGALSAAVRPGQWRQRATADGYTLLVRNAAPHGVYAIGSHGAPAASVSVRSNSVNATSIEVRSTHRVVVVRDVAFDVGWHAAVSVDGGPPRQVGVAPDGLVQQVTLPAGNDAVTFAYQPPHWVLASTLSELAALVLLALLAAYLVRRRLDRRPLPPSGDATVGELAVGVGQGEEELSLVGAPHGVDHEAGGE
jgi:hypothetical protein